MLGILNLSRDLVLFKASSDPYRQRVPGYLNEHLLLQTRACPLASLVLGKVAGERRQKSATTK